MLYTIYMGNTLENYTQLKRSIAILQANDGHTNQWISKWMSENIYINHYIFLGLFDFCIYLQKSVITKKKLKLCFSVVITTTRQH